LIEHGSPRGVGRDKERMRLQMGDYNPFLERDEGPPFFVGDVEHHGVRFEQEPDCGDNRFETNSDDAVGEGPWTNLLPIEMQPTLCIGVLGASGHGKSRLIEAMTGKRHSSQHTLGYANCRIYKCGLCAKYVPRGSAAPEEDCLVCVPCNEVSMQLVRHVSLVDCPESMEKTVGAMTVMNGAILVAAVDEDPEGLVDLVTAAEMVDVDNYVIVQSKVDRVSSRAEILQSARRITEVLEPTMASDSPMLPVSVETGLNVDLVARALVEDIPEPDRDLASPLRMSVVRSFKVSGKTPREIRGGVIGVSVDHGIVRPGMIIEVRPGWIHQEQDQDGVVSWCATPYYTRVVSLQTEDQPLEYAVPGGLVGVMTDLDPYLCMGDKLVGHVIGSPTTMPPVLDKIAIKYHKIKASVHLRASTRTVTVYVGTVVVSARVTDLIKDAQKGMLVGLDLECPVCCALKGTVVTVFIGKIMVGYGITVGGHALEKGRTPVLIDLLRLPADTFGGELPPEEVLSVPVEQAPSLRDRGGRDLSFDLLTMDGRCRWCRFYLQEMPELGDVVTVLVEGVNATGAHVTLPEYGHLPAFVPGVTERPKEHLECRVSAINPKSGSVDLTFEDVTDDEQEAQRDRYKEAVTAHRIVLRVAALYHRDDLDDLDAQQQTVEKIYHSVAWVIAQSRGETVVLDGLTSLPKLPEDEQEERLFPELGEKLTRLLVAEAGRATVVTPKRQCVAKVRLQSCNPVGVHAIRRVLVHPVAPGVRLVVDSPPLVELRIRATGVVAAAALWRSIRAIERRAEFHDCFFYLHTPPMVVGYADYTFPEFAGLEAVPDLNIAPTLGMFFPGSVAIRISASGMVESQALVAAFNRGIARNDPYDGFDVTASNEKIKERKLRYHEALEVVTRELPDQEDAKLRLPPLVISRQPNKTILGNFERVCATLDRPTEHFLQYVATQLVTKASSLNNGKSAVFHDRIPPAQIERVIKQYCADFVICPDCRSARTTLDVDSGALECKTCLNLIS